jgi:hypothetical protein
MTKRGEERDIPAPLDHPGLRATDDHTAGPAPRGGHQPTEGLDRGVGDEHLASPSQGVRPEKPSGDSGVAGDEVGAGSSDLLDDEASGGGPDGEEESGTGPAFEPER